MTGNLLEVDFDIVYVYLFLHIIGDIEVDKRSGRKGDKQTADSDADQIAPRILHGDGTVPSTKGRNDRISPKKRRNPCTKR